MLYSKALLLIRFSEPPRASAGRSGVRALMISVRAALLMEICSSSVVRVPPPVAE